jgi:AICAR transformylase/IMP cyclohydrolase PurH
MSINTDKLRSTYIKGKKAYFVSDIEQHFGERPVTKLVKNKSIFTERVKYGNNSQKRRLVFHKDLQNLPLETKGQQQNKKPMFNRIKEFYNKKKENICNKPEAKKVNFVAQDISLAEIRKTSISLETERNNMIKDRIKTLCNNEARKVIYNKKKAGVAIDAESRIDYREPYLVMYATFDRYMRAELAKFNTTLEDIGLGRAKNKANKPYIDRIAAAGQLHNLLVVAEALFQPTTK